MDEHMYGSVIKLLTRFGDFWGASDEFVAMVQNGMEVSPSTYDQGLIAMCKSQQWQKAVEIHSSWPSLRKHDVLEDGYGELIRACGYTRNWRYALELYKRMTTEKRMRPAYAQLVEALVASRQYKRALRFGMKLEQDSGIFYIDYKIRALLHRAAKLVDKESLMNLRESESSSEEEPSRRHPKNSTSKFSDSPCMIWSQIEEQLKMEDKAWGEFVRLKDRQEEEESLKGRNSSIRASNSSESMRACRFKDIPWPALLIPRNENEQIDVRSRAYFEYLATKDAGTTRRILKSLLLRWHPDKFLRRFTVATGERERILLQLHLLSVSLNKLMRRTEKVHGP